MRAVAGTGRALALFACFAAALVGTLFGVVAGLDALGVDYPRIYFGFAIDNERALESFREAETPRAMRVVLLGDSTVMLYPPERRVANRIEDAAAKLAPRGRRLRVQPVANLALTTFDFYFLAGEVAGARPDRIVVEFNLASFSDYWRSGLVHARLSGWLEPSELPHAIALPLHYIGLTADRILLHVALVRAGLAEEWYWLVREQARVGVARRTLAEEIDRLTGTRAERSFQLAVFADEQKRLFRRDLPDRYNEDAQYARFAPALAGVDAQHPVLRVFDRTLRIFRDAGIPTLVYVNPLNVDYLESLGLLDRDGLTRTIESVRRVARGNGADFLDLHDLFPDEGFRDAPGHFSTEGIDGPAVLGDVLAREILGKERAAPGR